uniref:Uncharacterized protein n=1 Tax=Anguilla anguilla TaxID=7936 RepID=A0A0E9QP28_ANGAN
MSTCVTLHVASQITWMLREWAPSQETYVRAFSPGARSCTCMLSMSPADVTETPRESKVHHRLLHITHSWLAGVTEN